MLDCIQRKYLEVKIEKFIYEVRIITAAIINNETKDDCLICKDDDCDPTLSCDHYYHEDCINQWFEKAENNNKCPYCQQVVEADIKDIQKIDWDIVSVRQKLSEGFIKEFKDKANWFNISSNQTLSESFVREFQEKVKWDEVSAR